MIADTATYWREIEHDPHMSRAETLDHPDARWVWAVPVAAKALLIEDFDAAVERMVDAEREVVSAHRERHGLSSLVEPGWTVSSRIGMRAWLRAAVGEGER